MITQKEMPEVGELVLIRITKIMPHGAYCKLAEYNLEAYLPIAEVSPGWIKNIHEFIREGQQDVAKTIFVDKVKRSVDISLKKATPNDKKNKINEYNTEKRAENIFNKALEASKCTDKKPEIISKIPKEITAYADIINDIVEGKDPLRNLPEKDFVNLLYETVKKSIKPKTYTVSYNIEVNVANPKSGVVLLKDIFKKIDALGAKVLYLGAPHYRVTSTDSSYPKAEARIKEAEHILEKYQKDINYNIKSNKA